MESNRHKLGVAGLALLLVAGVAGLIMGRATHSLAAQAGMVFAGLGFLVAAVGVFHMRLLERERLEKLEIDELSKSSSPGANLFAQGSETMPARKTREQFEKYFVPGFTVFLLLAEATAGILLWRWLAAITPEPIERHTLLLAVAGLFALLLFMMGRYVAGIVRLENNALLRPTAGFLLLNAYVFVAVAMGVAAVWLGFPSVDLWMARLFGAVLGLTALETLLTLVFEVYRPRVKGRQIRLLYDSRLVGLFSQPESLVVTMAHALDYQFGFKVSETWVYRFLQKGLAWIIPTQVGLLVLSTTFVVIEPGEQALLERLGRPVAGRQVLNPGLHFKLPWPIDKCYPYRTEQVQTFTIGIVGDEKIKEQTILWTVGHAKEEYNMLVASREPAALTNVDSGTRIPAVNLLAVNLPVQYQVTNLVEWAYNFTDAAGLLEQIAAEEVVRYLVNADIHETMTTGRGGAAETLRGRIQAAVNQRQLGARIVFVGLAGIHPPVDVAEAYQHVVSAMQGAEALGLSARAYAIRTNAAAGAAAYQREQQAMAEKLQLERDAYSRAAAFTNQIPAFAASPGVYAARAFLQTISRSTADARKYVLTATNTEDVLQLNLEDKINMNLLDAAAEMAPQTK